MKYKCFICQTYDHKPKLLKSNMGYVHKDCIRSSKFKAGGTISRLKPKDTVKRKKVSKNELKTTKQLIKILTRWFNEYIRLRDTDINGKGNCIACGKSLTLGDGQIQAGHFIPSTRFVTRFNEYNLHIECKRCNHFLSGNLTKYEENLKKKIGEYAVKKLKESSETVVKQDRNEIELMIEHYKKRVKEMRKEKCL